MEWVALWLAGAVVVGAVASARNRSVVGWFALALLISPLLAIVAVALMPAAPRPGSTPDTAPSVTTHRACPQCAEWVLVDALKCRHCGTELDPPPHASAEARARAQARNAARPTSGSAETTE